MSRNDIILGVVALVLVVFSLFVSIVLPRRRPDFPANRLGAFTAVAVLLVVAMLVAVELFGDEHAAADEAAHVEGEEEDADDGEAAGEGEAQGDPARGEQVFAENGCANCHVLESAGATSTVGPNLDDARPTFERTVEQVRDGGGGMPAFGDQLSDEDIRAVAAYVVQSTQ